ncbi:hypothetical protein OHB54_05165 [Streptomyces sp. NBC_01007]|nr:hypothetical protein OHB54_05165 [Streptomyces sp. NBC_01007]
MEPDALYGDLFISSQPSSRFFGERQQRCALAPRIQHIGGGSHLVGDGARHGGRVHRPGVTVQSPLANRAAGAVAQFREASVAVFGSHASLWEKINIGEN